jgi:hypothetical protein
MVSRGRRHKWYASVCTECGCQREVRDIVQSPHGTSSWPVYRYAMPGQEWVTKAPACEPPPDVA